MPAWLLLVLMVFTVFRLTRLVTTDDFPPVLALRDHLAGGWRPMTEPEWLLLAKPRDAGAPEPFAHRDINKVENRFVVRAAWSPHWLAELITCPWCTSGWLAGAVTAATALTTSLPAPWLAGPAVWGAAALLASWRTGA
jgi:hypothetical protein